MTQSNFACGHPDLPSNAYKNGQYRRCATCQRARVAALRDKQKTDMHDDINALRVEVAELRAQLTELTALRMAA